MKIAAVIDNSITAGGGFNQALNAVLQMARLCEGRYEFIVFTSVADNIDYLRRFGITIKHYRTTIIDKIIAYAATSPLGRRIQNKLRWLGKLERGLLLDGVDLVYFVTPSSRCLSLQQLNYITTVWDLSHHDMPEFPEVRKYNTFLSREFLYRHTLAQALFVVCDSNKLAERITSVYAVDRHRVIAMPFAPAPFLEGRHSTPKKVVMDKYDLVEGYYFYPSQFWAHKNHIRIIQALAVLKGQGIECEVVFCGGDQGNLAYIRSVANSFGLERSVRFLGFVPAEDIRSLYEGCSAVIMPSYFGPTNIPPLEAWKLRRPLIYSDLFAEQADGAALLINPDSAAELADAMRNVLDQNVANDLIQQGAERLSQINAIRTATEQEILNLLETFSSRLECWDSNLKQRKFN